MDPRELDRDVAGAAAAHQRLLADLDEITGRGGADPAAPSALPGWSVGHVLTHIARQGDSVVRMLDGLEQYERGAAGRSADIEAGADRPWAELVSDVRRSIWRLETRWASGVDWDGRARTVVGDLAMTEVPFRRWRETAIHHIDLGLGAGFADLPSDYVRLELRRMEMLWKARRPMGLTPVPEQALRRPPHERLAWFLGRGEIDGLGPAGIF